MYAIRSILCTSIKKWTLKYLVAEKWTIMEDIYTSIGKIIYNLSNVRISNFRKFSTTKW